MIFRLFPLLLAVADQCLQRRVGFVGRPAKKLPARPREVRHITLLSIKTRRRKLTKPLREPSVAPPVLSPGHRPTKKDREATLLPSPQFESEQKNQKRYGGPGGECCTSAIKKCPPLRNLAEGQRNRLTGNDLNATAEGRLDEIQICAVGQVAR